ncbi:hypothetical protein BD408DRAFT_419278 [Parasitella parasitica]|nr:hypothetical protein BD408DRAFT_419278 [Parasitella parasitica]
MLWMHINYQHQTEFHQLPLLLPNARRSFTKIRWTSTIDMLYRSMDMLPRDYDLVSINYATGLKLPLQTILYTASTSSYKFPRDLRLCLSKHPTMLFLHWKDPAHPFLIAMKRVPRQLMPDIEQGSILIQPFFLPLCDPAAPTTNSSTAVSFRPFTDQLLVDLDPQAPTARCSSRSFREACSSSVVAPQHLSAIDPSAWTFFWSLTLTMVQRNVLYRYINTCTPYQFFLNRLFPLIHLSPLCIACSSTVDSVDHFLFTSVPKAMSKAPSSFSSHRHAYAS